MDFASREHEINTLIKWFLGEKHWMWARCRERGWDSNDITQRVWVRLLSGDPPEGYKLSTIVYNATRWSLAYRRKQDRFEVGSVLFTPSVPDQEGEQAPDVVEAGELQERIYYALSTLLTRERLVIELRYGLQDGFTHTLEECGRILGLSRERIRQIESKGLKKLQHHSRANRIRQVI